MRALVVAAGALSVGCGSAAPPPPAQPTPMPVTDGALTYELPPGWSERYQLSVFPIANRTGGSITADLEAAWQAIVTPRSEGAPPIASYRRRLASGYAMAYAQSGVSLYLLYADERYVPILVTGLDTGSEAALSQLFASISIRGVPPSKTPLFAQAEVAGHWSTTGSPLRDVAGEELVLEPKGHVDWYWIGPSESGREIRNTASGLWRIDDDILVTERHHDIVKRRIWAREGDTLVLTREGTAQPRFFNAIDTTNSSWFKEL